MGPRTAETRPATISGPEGKTMVSQEMFFVFFFFDFFFAGGQAQRPGTGRKFPEPGRSCFAMGPGIERE